MAKPTPELYIEAERVLLYLSQTRDLGLSFPASSPSPHTLHGASDSD